MIPKAHINPVPILVLLATRLSVSVLFVRSADMVVDFFTIVRVSSWSSSAP